MGATPDNTAAILQRMLQRDGAAWQELTREYSGFLLAIVRRTFAAYGIRTTPQDHEDAVADVWKNLLENDGRVVRQCIERSNFLQTLQVLARNRSIDLMRKRQGQVVPLVAELRRRRAPAARRNRSPPVLPARGGRRRRRRPAAARKIPRQPLFPPGQKIPRNCGHHRNPAK